MLMCVRNLILWLIQEHLTKISMIVEAPTARSPWHRMWISFSCGYSETPDAPKPICLFGPTQLSLSPISFIGLGFWAHPVYDMVRLTNGELSQNAVQQMALGAASPPSMALAEIRRPRQQLADLRPA